MQFYEKFTAYVEHTRNKFISKGKYDRAVADSISGTFEREHGKNHYIFLNEYGKPLSQQAWNLRLKDYFLAAGIPLDVAVKHDNLNHRFRHGCAMYYLRFAEKKMTIEEVHSLMRHRSFNSTYIYLKVTIDDELILRQQFQDSLLKELPLLVE